MWERFAWWFGHESTSIPTLVQLLSTVVATAMTGVLCWVTYKYMVLTKHLANIATEQLRAAVRPVITVGLWFQGGVSPAGQSIFKDSIVVEVVNAGATPLVVKRVFLEWEHSSEIPQARVEAPGFRSRVIVAAEKKSERVSAWYKGSLPVIEHFDSWSDFFTVVVHCSDLGELSPVTYIHQNATGLRIGT